MRLTTGSAPDLLNAPRVKPPTATAAEVRAALMRRFCAPEWALLFEVGDATGARHSRFADALAMSLWPSRGLELHGMEIKVSKYDWRNEKANPEKAETIAAYCDRWYLVTGPGVIDQVDEIPSAWGWLDFDGERIVTVKEAAHTEAKVCDRRFLAALLRRASKSDDVLMEAEVARRIAQAEAKIDERVASAIKMRLRNQDSALRDVEAFEAAAGLKIAGFYGWSDDAADTGRAVAAVTKSGVDKTYLGLQSAAETLRSSAAKIEEALAEIGFNPRPAVTPPKMLRKGRR